MDKGRILSRMPGMLSIANDAPNPDKWRDAIIACLVSPQNPGETLHTMQREKIDWAKRPQIQPGRRMLGPNGLSRVENNP